MNSPWNIDKTSLEKQSTYLGSTCKAVLGKLYSLPQYPGVCVQIQHNIYILKE